MVKHRRFAALLVLLLAAPLPAQDPAGLLPTLFFLGEWHVGASQVPGDLMAIATDGNRRALGWSFPVPVGDAWQVRPRYDDGLFTGSESWGPGTSLETRILQRHFGLDVLYTLGGDRRDPQPTVYFGAGAGAMQTIHERRANGILLVPGLPSSASQETWSPAGRVCAGLQLTPWLAVEAQVQTSAHRFLGTRFTDTFGTLGVRFWLARMLGSPSPR